MKTIICHTIDVRGGIAPFTLLKICHAFKKLHPGQCLEVMWNDKDTAEDLLKILPAQCFMIESMTQMEDGILKLRKLAPDQPKQRFLKNGG